MKEAEMRTKTIFILLVILAFSVVAGGCGSNGNTKDSAPKDVVSSYRYDREKERWVQNVEFSAPSVDGSGTGHTIIIRLKEDDPVQEIRIQKALIIDPDSPVAQTLLEINGQSDLLSTGKINIGTLTFLRVDAQEMEVNADVVRSSLENVVAEDDEMHLDLSAVDVVRTTWGGATVLHIGMDENDGVIDTTGIAEKTGVRTDKIRILGPSSGTAFVERITIAETAVFGKIQVSNVAIRDLVMQDISLDD